MEWQVKLKISWPMVAREKGIWGNLRPAHIGCWKPLPDFIPLVRYTANTQLTGRGVIS